VAFHDLTHWTAHKSRLDRDLKNRFGARNYAAEELVAELGAAFLCAEFGFDSDLRHAGYIGHWSEGRQASILHRLQPSIKSRELPARFGACRDERNRSLRTP
jgi:antirestriction protein ArdC